MPKARTPRSTTARRPLALISASALIAFAGIAGCSKSDDAKAAVNTAARSLGTIAAGDPTATPTNTKKVYSEIESSVADHAGSENGYSEAAAITLSLSKLGQASLASIDAAKTETQALHKGRIVRGMLNEWLTMSAIAQAAGQFDASDERRDIEQLIELRKDDVTKYTAQREAMNAQIEELDAQIADLQAKAEVERNEAGGLELEMPRVSATKAAELVVRVREHSLRADGYELEAVRIQGVVGQLRPGAREIGLNVDKAKSQITLLESARAELAERESASRNDAREAQQAASAAVERIADAVADYAQFRESEVSSANAKAISLARGAISALRDAKGPTKQVSALTESSAQQTLAESHARQAAGFGEAAILYNALIESNVPGDWSALAQQATDSQAESTTEANTAFEKAASTLRRARIGGDEGDKAEATATRLELLAGIEPEPEYDDSYEEEPVNYDDTEEDYDEESLDEPVDDED